MAPQPAHTGPWTLSWQRQQFTASSWPGASVPPTPAVSRWGYRVKESPQEQEREASGLWNSKPLCIMPFL